MKAHYYIYITFLCVALFSCNAKQKDDRVVNSDAMKLMQGIWTNNDDESVAFKINSDTLYYPNGNGDPVAFVVYDDSMFIESSTPICYRIKTVSHSTLTLLTQNGEEISLSRSCNSDDSKCFISEKILDESINQGVLIKKDSVMTSSDTRYHVYTQVNPTKYRVVHQSINDDGLQIENTYYDNIIHVSVFSGSISLYSHDFRKSDFASLASSGFIEHSILSDIKIVKADADGVKLTAILIEPETYSSFHVNIVISKEGKEKLSV